MWIANGRRDVQMKFVGIVDAPAPLLFFQHTFVRGVLFQPGSDKSLDGACIRSVAQRWQVAHQVNIELIGGYGLDRGAKGNRPLGIDLHLI